jgi:hypothetical protein
MQRPSEHSRRVAPHTIAGATGSVDSSAALAEGAVGGTGSVTTGEGGGAPAPQPVISAMAQESGRTLLFIWVPPPQPATWVVREAR